jgi:hypothetical protein
MTDKTMLVRFKRSEIGSKSFVAASAEWHGDNLVLLNSQGKLVAVFLATIVESWTESAL